MIGQLKLKLSFSLVNSDNPLTQTKKQPRMVDNKCLNLKELEQAEACFKFLKLLLQYQAIYLDVASYWQFFPL